MSRLPAIALKTLTVCWLWLLLLGPALEPVYGQRKRKDEELPPPPPPAVARTITVRPGETVPVELAIHGGGRRPVEFLIRSQPKAGKLSAVQATAANAAVVQYTAGKEAGPDRFTYAARTEEGVSAPAVVNVTIMIAPALPSRLMAVEAVDFPAIVSGEQSTAILEVTNQGGGVAEGELTLPEGWSVEGSAKYKIAAGKKVEFKLVFAPGKPGEYVGQATFGPLPRRVVALTGISKSPLEIAPAALTLEAPRGSQARAGKLRIENRTAEPREIKLGAGPRLMLERTVTIGAKEGKDVEITVAPGDPTAFDDKLKLESTAWTAEVPVRVAPLAMAAKFKGAAPKFGEVKAGQKAEAVAELENPGGTPAIVQMRVGAPFELSAAGVEVPARGTARVPVTIQAAKPGVYSAELTAETAGVVERVPISVEVAPADAPASPPSVTSTRTTTTPAAPVKQPHPVPAPAGARALPPLNAGIRADSPTSLGKYTRNVTDESAVLEWPVSLGAGTALAVQEREIAAGPDGMPATKWKPIQKARLSEANGMRRAELDDLDADRLYVVRVVSGNETVFTTKFVTLVDKPWIDVSWRSVVVTLLLVGLGAVGWIRWKGKARSGW